MLSTPKDLLNLASEQRTPIPYFGLGFLKTTLEHSIYQKILDHFSRHKDSFYTEQEIPYLQTNNHSYSPALMVHDQEFNRNLCQELKPVHEEWSGMKLRESFCYGIRIYQPGSFLYNHVDRAQTHIISSTICVGHRLNAPWPLYIEDIEGHPHEISMEPGEMVFYEGAKLIHGRPYPLNGRYYAGIFVHYIPAYLYSEGQTVQ